MKKLNLASMVGTLIIAFAANLSAQTATQICTSAIAYTSCFPWTSTAVDGPNLPNGKHDDTHRLNQAITATLGKLVFDEAEYYITDELTVYSYRILEGTGRSTFVGTPVHASSKIIQMTNNKPIFKIGTNITNVSVRDLALVAGSSTSGTMGILAQGNCGTNCSSFAFQFSNLNFDGFATGIFVNATDTLQDWQFDNIRIDHSGFSNCLVGIHINSNNSGWNMSSLEFSVPADDPQHPAASNYKTYGIWLERSTYTSMNLLIGNGPSSTGPSLGTKLIYVNKHGNLSIQNIVAEGFRRDIEVDSPDRNSPINLMNNAFLNGIDLNNATVYSTSNQFFDTDPNDPNAIPAASATGGSQIYSIGDKFCIEGSTGCDEGRGYVTTGDARVIFSSNQNGNKTLVPFLISKDIYPSTTDPVLASPSFSILAPTTANGPLMRLGRGAYYFDISRSEANATLTFTPNSNQAGYGYTFNNRGGIFSFNGGNLVFNPTDLNEDGNTTTGEYPAGTITVGSTTYSGLGSSANGTLYYCSNCQQSNPCSSGGSGALAKRIAGSWICN